MASPDEIPAKPATQTPLPPPGSGRAQGAEPEGIIRLPVSDMPLDDVYEAIRVIDNGNGMLGGMNSGVYVVRKQGTGQLFVQKRYITCDATRVKTFRDEISFMRNLVHSSIVQYVDAYMVTGCTTFVASVYMEYCDRGTLSDVLGRYKRKKKQWKEDFVPESFVWHAFLGLADALHFLRTGQSCLSVSLQKNDPSTWRPVLHRDIKPDNVFLRSRSTPGSTKPVYLLLSDFGVASYEPTSPGSPPFDAFGTPEYLAPELCFDPYPTPQQKRYLQSPHTAKSDIWALACIMYCLCERDALAHLDRKCYPLRSQRALGRRARRPVLEINDKAVYSEYLERSIVWAAEVNPTQRPDAVELIAGIKTQSDLWIADPNWAQQVAELLPEWAAPKS